MPSQGEWILSSTHHNRMLSQESIVERAALNARMPTLSDIEVAPYEASS